LKEDVMIVRDIMTRIVVKALPDTSAEDAARMMKKNAVGFLPVEDLNREVRGVITDRDITVRLVAEGLNAKETRVRHLMTPQTTYCFEDQDLEDASLRMADSGLRRMLVYDRRHDLVGVLSLDDIAAKTSKEKLAGHVLARIAKAA
jgi:CBS domain-containing protein